MLELQEYKCAITGDELTPDNVALDHIVPLSRDGENSLSNVHLVTREVNEAKRAKDYESFVDMCRKVVEHYDKRCL